MPSDRELADALVGRLTPLPVTVRPLFGSAGLYLEGRYFGLVAGGTVYFRTDDQSRQDYVDRGMAAYQPANRPRGPKTVDRNFAVPDDVLADDTMLREWALRAAEAAKRR